MLKTIIKSVAVTAGIAVTLSSGAFAQTYISDTTFAKVPFRVNVDATITAVQGDDTISKAVTGKTTGADTLKIPLEITITTAVRDAGKVQGRLNAPTITGTRGNITLRLPAQSYSNAEVALHSVNGKRILRGKADAKDAVSGISRRNIAAGVYLLSVKGNNGTFTTRLTHSGGKMNINVAFGTENASRSPARNLGKKADVEEGDWEITVSAEFKKDSSYILKNLVEGNNTLQDITLIGKPTPTQTTFIDERDDTPYKKVTIGTQTWMAENLNYDNSVDGCYQGIADSCAKYGRLYNYNSAMKACPAGWHLPSIAEWEQLIDFVGGGRKAIQNLKTTSGWVGRIWNVETQSYDVEPNNGTDDYGFSALPGGAWRNVYEGAGTSARWWSSSFAGCGMPGSCARNLYFSSDRAETALDNQNDKFSVRCVQNEEEE